ncbi:hypothetical protein, partial [Campylobacter sp.]|uniref:hypothetical protein n=1 Tax=Campylobacter sp. TaxID=205 RepID=UPI002AA6E962
ADATHKMQSKQENLYSSGVLGAPAPKGLGRSSYKICELDLSSLKASKNLKFLYSVIAREQSDRSNLYKF